MTIYYKTMLKKRLLGILCIALASNTTFAQDKQNMFNPVNTAVTSLSIPTDATGLALGYNGVATNPDNNSQYWNPAKYVFTEERAAIGHSYTQCLKRPLNDIYKLNTAGHFNFKDNAISFSCSYFRLGKVYLSGMDDMTIKPYELSFDIAYSRKLNEELSVAVATRYIHSDIKYDYTAESSAGNALAFDIATYWKHKAGLLDISLGGAIKNIGTKITYGGSDNTEFIPTDLSLGAGVDLHPHHLHHFQAFLQLDKLLVPTYPKQKEGEAEEDYIDRVQKDYYDISPIKGIFKSFGDAPNGFKEEMQEISVSIGFEYCMFKKVKFRTAYHHEAANKGNRKFISYGVGLSLMPIDLNICMIKATSKGNPFDKTISMDFALKLPYLDK